MVSGSAVVAVFAVAAVVRMSGTAPESQASTRDARTMAVAASHIVAEQPAAAAAAQVAASATTQQLPTVNSSARITGDDEGGQSSVTNNENRTSALTIQEVNDLFFVEDYCNVTSGGDENLKQRCHRAGELADLIVSVPRMSVDSWAYGMEHELNRHLTELSQPGADWGVIHRKEARCNAVGCVVYMEGPARWGYSFKRLMSAIERNPVIAQLNEQQRFPGPGYWDQKVNDQAMLVLPR